MRSFGHIRSLKDDRSLGIINVVNMMYILKKNSRSELLLLIALRRSGGGVEGIGGSGERKKGSPLPLIPIPRGTTVQT